ncbi:DUF6248 family natural product biosynthesis protein [Spongiactinospora sp. TRM90649]|uniref:DUF6248 family natural product biosynthesis protein n=1 Tax=Spongiactinospora sp. TRM90649 TaxID=3031114 RepID=UPI0023F9DD8A|nr:DUF6248 family natural product biosynthesis protein [Spongiactinospora sp. TRM90649]MDF5758586.1 hypothetical protein [Spongiactinospora sp. TRM90649]
MTPEQAAWVREHAWTTPMRKNLRDTPAFYTTCHCQAGLSHWCSPEVDQHARCHRGSPLTTWEGLICDRTGVHPVRFAEPFDHPTAPGAAGEPRRERLAVVWLADRVCRWICPCTCHQAARRVARKVRYEVVELPDMDLPGLPRNDSERIGAR